MVILALAIIIILNTIIQSTLLPYISIFGFVPNTALILIVVISLLKGKYYGGFFGLFLGLLQDIIFGTVVGVNGIIYFVLGYIIGSIQSILNIENAIVPSIFTAITTVLYNLIYFVFMFFLSRDISIDFMIGNTFSIEILYNSILAIFAYKIAAKFFVTPSLRFVKR